MKSRSPEAEKTAERTGWGIVGAIGNGDRGIITCSHQSRSKTMDAEIEIQIRECEARLYAAMAASDVSELDLLIADDLLFVGPTGELATKAMDLDLHRTGGTQFHEFVPKDLEIRVWSDQFVLAVAQIFLSGTYLGNAFAGDYRYVRVWRKGQHGWQIAGGSVSAIV